MKTLGYSGVLQNPQQQPPASAKLLNNRLRPFLVQTQPFARSTLFSPRVSQSAPKPLFMLQTIVFQALESYLLNIFFNLPKLKELKVSNRWCSRLTGRLPFSCVGMTNLGPGNQRCSRMADGFMTSGWNKPTCQWRPEIGLVLSEIE